ncbi:MAG: hypothetical protein WKF31_02835 [Thermoleophilaceae bacterium]
MAVVARRALRAVPEPLKERMRLAAAYVRLTSDRESLRRFAAMRRAAPADDPAAVEPVAVRARALGGREVLVRPGTSDADTLWDALVRRYHLPPPEAGVRGSGGAGPGVGARPRREHRADGGAPGLDRSPVRG